MRSARWQSERGVCLAEMMIALLAGTIALSATIDSLQHIDRRLRAQHAAVDRVEDERLGLQVLQEELRLARPGLSDDPAILKVSGQEIEFWANLDGLNTQLTAAITGLETTLPVRDGTGWRKGKRVVVCDIAGCAESKLDRDGRRTSVVLANALGRAMAVGSSLTVTNRVRYYMGRDGNGQPALMRQVDGGANPIIAQVTAFQLRCLDRHGRPTTNPADVTRIQVKVTVGSGGRNLTTDVAIQRH